MHVKPLGSDQICVILTSLFKVVPFDDAGNVRLVEADGEKGVGPVPSAVAQVLVDKANYGARISAVCTFGETDYRPSSILANGALVYNRELDYLASVAVASKPKRIRRLFLDKTTGAMMAVLASGIVETIQKT